MATNDGNKGAAIGLLIFLLAIIGLFVCWIGFCYVPAGNVGVKDRLGSVDMTPLQPGVYWTGFLATVHNMDTRIQKVEYSASAASKDMQTVNTKVAVNYKISPAQAPRIYKDIGMSYQDVIIQPLVQEAIKSQTAKFNAEELITNREDIKTKITDYLTSRLFEKDLEVTQISITDFDFSVEFNKAIEAKQVAAQRALEAENKLKAMEFDAKALQLQKLVLDVKKLDIQLAFINKWDGKLPTYVMGDNGVMQMLPLQPVVG